ncbi:TPA: hypothetical protein N0F65_008186 [Lagenidium giganteum]|uniref:chorismate mutase n=1 Tax=Lagenidium giganteum TaxID=4803 RepID=A0AAV2YIJ6_9STRA|nr:TPA: hypothetical protein N0F65_008186 [Lagenidium giganteum]
MYPMARMAPTVRGLARLLSRPVATNAWRAAALQYAVPMQQARSFGVFSNLKDTVTQKMEQRNQVKQEDAYRQQINDLAHCKKFNLTTFHDQLKKNAEASGINGWKSYIPGVSEMAEHLENPNLINGKVKRKISEKCGHSAAEVNNMLRQYEQMSALQMWLSKRVERNLHLPDTMEETTELVRQDPTGFPAKKFRRGSICSSVPNQLLTAPMQQALQSSHHVVFSDPLKPVRLDDFRNVLIRQEETIIFALIERAQFPRNSEIYRKRNEAGSVSFGGLKGKYDAFTGSFLDFMFSETEKLHALNRRYTSPDENAFYPHLLPEPILPSLSYPQVLKPNRININDQISSVYLKKILPGITEDRSDHTSFGSTATADITVLQALSKRIHFGKFIAEAKFQAERERYTELIMANDAEGIMTALTNMAVEEKVLKRVKLKASTYGQDVDETSGPKDYKVDPQLISDLYRDFVMPLTKEVQVAYLLQRLAHPAISVAGVEGSFCWLAAQAHFGGEGVAKDHFVSEDAISKVFGDVAANRTAYGVVPIEDSSLGMIKETQAQLLQSSLKVSAEIVLAKQFIFASKCPEQVKTGDVSAVFIPTETDTRLLVHVEQCWPTAKVINVANVTEAAVRAAADPSTIAITTCGAAKLQGIRQLEAGNALATATWKPSTADTSFIRFVVISQGFPAPTGADKSCLSMALKHEVGSLLSALEIWKNHGVNLCCIESIYRQDGLGFDFFVEILGHIEDKNVQEAVNKLQEAICQVKHLGSFPAAKREISS